MHKLTVFLYLVDEPFEYPKILKVLQNVTNWFLLGTYLNIEQHDLKKIQLQYSHDGIDRCKLEMVKCWRRNDPTANWQKLRQALQSRNYDLTKSQKADGKEHKNNQSCMYEAISIIGASLSEPHIDHDNVPRHGECLYLSMYLSGCV